MNQMQWTAEMAKMQHTYGAPISEAEIKQLRAYLAVAYGSAKKDDPTIAATLAVTPAASTSPAPPVSDGNVDAQALLVHNACLSCATA